jgi:hypothetical protein
LNTRLFIYLILLLIGVTYLFIILSVDVNAYSLNRGRVIYSPNSTTSTTLKHISVIYVNVNQTLIDKIKNTDCREIESAGVQAGCIIERNKILVMLGEPETKFSNKPIMTSVNTPNMDCFKDLGGYVDFGAGYHLQYINDDNTESPVNRSKYPRGIRVYIRHYKPVNETVKNSKPYLV